MSARQAGATNLTQGSENFGYSAVRLRRIVKLQFGIVNPNEMVRLIHSNFDCHNTYLGLKDDLLTRKTVSVFLFSAMVVKSFNCMLRVGHFEFVFGYCVNSANLVSHKQLPSMGVKYPPV